MKREELINLEHLRSKMFESCSVGNICHILVTLTSDGDVVLQHQEKGQLNVKIIVLE